MVQIACRKNMTSASIQQMLHLGCIIQWFFCLDLPLESSGVSQNQRRSKHNWAGVGGEQCGYYSWGWSSLPLLFSHREADLFCINHRWLWHTISPSTGILQGHFYLRENTWLIELTRKYMCVVDTQSIRYIHYMKYEVKETRKGRGKGAKTVYKLPTEQQEGIMGNLCIEIFGHVI